MRLSVRKEAAEAREAMARLGAVMTMAGRRSLGSVTVSSVVYEGTQRRSV